jgi:hypothetical protein
MYALSSAHLAGAVARTASIRCVWPIGGLWPSGKSP